MASKDRQRGAWETEIKRPCYVSAPGCPPQPGRGTQHWCTGERGHRSSNIARGCAARRTRDAATTHRSYTTGWYWLGNGTISEVLLAQAPDSAPHRRPVSRRPVTLGLQRSGRPCRRDGGYLNVHGGG